MSTITTYTYNGTMYSTASAVRKAIWANEHKAFGPVPYENVDEFWAEHGVTLEYTEESVEDLKARKLAELNSAFMQWREEDAVLASSLGFTADADERAMVDVNGLCLMARENETFTSYFMDHDNTAHALTADQIVTLMQEVFQASLNAYTTKWTLRTAIETAETKEELDAIEIEFTASDFSGTE